MKQIGKLTLAALVSLAFMAEAAAAQVAGVPVYFNPRGGTGFSVAANAASTSSDAGDSKAYAVSGAVGLNRLQLSATVGRYDPDGVDNTETSYGAMAELRLLGGSLLPLSVSAGAGIGVVKSGTETLTEIPIGVGLQASIPMLPISPWIAPRIQLSRGLDATGGMTSATSFGVSAGVNFSLLLGLGFHAAVDYRKLPAKLDANKSAVTTVGFGGHFNFRVPMM